MQENIALLKLLRKQIAAIEAGEQLEELNKTIIDPQDYAKAELEDSGIKMIGWCERRFTDVFWTRTGAKGIRRDIHVMKIVLVKLPDDTEELRCGFGYEEAIAVHGERLPRTFVMSAIKELDSWRGLDLNLDKENPDVE